TALSSLLFSSLLFSSLLFSSLLFSSLLFSSLHTAGRAALKPSTADVPDSLGRLCRWHRQLCDVVDALAACFQASLLVGIAFCFSNSVLGVYTFITKYKDRVPLAVKVPSAIWTACYSCRLVLFSTVPADTVAQARKTRVLVERLNNRSLDADSKQEIEIFISHLSSRHVTFTVCGFFTLDLLFLRSVSDGWNH
ncbi:hypothetical protein ANN_16422, partial [Periplaneta americana]